MIQLLLISFFALSAPSRTSHYTCTLELALSPNDASASIASGTTRAPESEGKPRKQADPHHANLVGRGVASCKNESGFQFNLPAVMAISLNSDEQIPLQSLRASVEPVSVDHDVNKIFDLYTPHIELKKTPSASSNISTDRSIVVKGDKNDVLLQINLSLPQEVRSKVEVTKVDLKFDR